MQLAVLVAARWNVWGKRRGRFLDVISFVTRGAKYITETRHRGLRIAVDTFLRSDSAYNLMPDTLYHGKI